MEFHEEASLMSVVTKSLAIHSQKFLAELTLAINAANDEKSSPFAGYVPSRADVQ